MENLCHLNILMKYGFNIHNYDVRESPQCVVYFKKRCVQIGIDLYPLQLSL